MLSVRKMQKTNQVAYVSVCNVGGGALTLDGCGWVTSGDVTGVSVIKPSPNSDMLHN